MADVAVLLDCLYHIQSVHDGHHDVADKEIGQMLLRHFQSFLSVHRLNDAVAFGKDVAQEASQLGVVLYNQYRLRFVRFVFRLVFSRENGNLTFRLCLSGGGCWGGGDVFHDEFRILFSLIGVCFQRQGDDEFAAFSLSAVHPDAALVQFYQFLDQ